MNKKKLHIDATTPDLLGLLEELGVAYVDGCVLHGLAGGTSPLAAMALRVETTTQLQFDVICNRPASGFVVGDFVISGPVTGAVLVGGPQLFSLILTKTGTGTVSVALPDGFAQDPNNDDFPAIAAIEVELTRRPTVEITGPDEVGFDAVTLDVVFDEDVTGLSAGDFEVVDGALTNLLGSGDTYTVDLTVTLGETDTQVMLPAYRVVNVDARPNLSSNTYRPVVAHVSPTPTITPQRPVFSTLVVTFIVEWSVPVSGYFEDTMLSITNGDLIEMTALSSTRYQVNILATTASDVTLTIDAEEFTIPGYAPSAAGTGSCEIDLDALTFAVVGPVITNEEEITLTVSGSRAHSGLLRSSFKLTNAVTRYWTPAGNGGTLVVVPNVASGRVLITVQIPGGIIRSTTGAYNEPSNVATVVYDASRPIVSLVRTYVEDDTVIFELETNEFVTLYGSYTYTGATTEITGAGQSWLLSLTPGDELGLLGTLSPVLPEGLFVDQAGNYSAATTLTPFAYDFQGPVGTWVLVPDGHALDRPTNKASRVFELNFDAPIRTQLTPDSFVLSTGLDIVSFVVVSDNERYLITVECRLPSSTVTLQLPAEAATDDLLNPMAEDLEVGYLYDSIAPTYLSCVITDRPTQKIWTLTLSENVTVPAYASHLVTSGVSITDVTVSGDVVQITGTPLISGRIGIKLLRGLAVDLADNESAETGFFYVISDITGPTVAITSPLSPSTYRTLIPVRIEFDEPLSAELQLSDLDLTNCRCNPVLYPLTRFSVTTANRIYALTVEAISSGAVSIAVPAGRVTDPSGNPNDAGTLTIGYAPFFTMVMTADPGDHIDQHIITLASENDLDYSLITEDTFVLLGGSRRISRISDTEFLLTTDPSATTANVQIPQGAVQDLTNKTNLLCELTLSLTPVTGVATLTTSTPYAIVNTPVVVDVSFNIYVERISAAQFTADIRTGDLQIVSGSGLVGDFTDFEVIEPGYRYRLTYQATNYPASYANDLHIWHSAITDGTADLAGRLVTHMGYVPVPLRRPFAPVISSEQSPETIDQVIVFSVEFPALLDVDAVITDFELINCRPDTGLVMGDDNGSYTVTVLALTPGDVTLRLPANTLARADNGELNEATELSVAWLGSSKFLLSVTVGPYLRTDQRLLTIVPSIPMDMTQVTVGSLQYDDTIMELEDFATGQFLMTLRPGVRSGSVIVPENAYVSYAESNSRFASVTVSWSITDLAPRVNITEARLTYPNVLHFEVIWPVKVDGFTNADIEASLRDVHLRTVSGFDSAGAVSVLTEFIPGYEFRGTFTLDAQPTTSLYMFYIWCTSGGCDDIFGGNITAVGYRGVPVDGPFSLLITSPDSPGTSRDFIQFDLRPSTPIATELALADIDLDNCVPFADAPGGPFQVVTPLQHYRLYVTSDEKGDVTITVPEDTIVNTSGTGNAESLLSVYYDRKFDIACTISAGDKADRARLDLALPGDVDDVQLLSSILSFDPNKIAYATRIDGEDAFMLQLKLPNGKSATSNNVNITVTILHSTLTATDGAVNRPIVVTGAIPYIPWAITLTCDDPVVIGQSMDFVMTSNWFIYMDSFPTAAGYVAQQDAIPFAFQLLNRNTLLPTANSRLTWTIGFQRDLLVVDEAGYEFSWAQTVTAVRYADQDALYVYSNHPGNINRRVGYSLAGQWLTASYRNQLDLYYPNSEVLWSWTGGGIATRYLTVTMTGDNTGHTEALSVDWGDGSSVEDIEFDDSLRRSSTEAVFVLQHAYADSDEYTVELISQVESIRITGVEVSSTGTYEAGEPGYPWAAGETDMGGVTNVVATFPSDIAKLGLGTPSLPTTDILQNLLSLGTITHLSTNMHADDNLLFYGPNGLGDTADTKFNLQFLSIYTDQNIWTMLAKDIPLPNSTEYTTLENFYGDLRWLRIAGKTALGTSAIRPLRLTADGIGDSAGRNSVAEIRIDGPLYSVVGTNKVNNVAALPNKLVLSGSQITAPFIYDARVATYRERVMPTNIEIVGCNFSKYEIPLNYDRNEGQYSWALPLQEITLAGHKMTKEAELEFYRSIRTFVMSVVNPDQLPVECVVYTQRIEDMYVGPEGNGPTAETYAIIQSIRDRLVQIGRPNAFRITAE